MKRFFKFFISKQYLKHVLMIIGVWILIVLLESWYLKWHTDFGEQIEVPSFYGLHVEDLDALIAGKDIKYEIKDSVYLDEWPKGTICWQYPRPTDSTGMYVKAGRTIQLSVVPMTPKMLVMPDVVDMSKRMAETTLNSMGFRTTVTFKPAPEGKDFVLGQLYNGKPIPAGTMIPKGSRVELIVAKGNSGESTPLPNLIGLTILQAQERLQTLTLTLYPECESCVTEADFANAVITNQNPAGGEGVNVAAGSTITVWATK
ncbi:MAG: PASTA domain-containing protein [Bacteroidetes bacterium]|nr:PASTA domain-containing protein [Bacteroidota bacterium]